MKKLYIEVADTPLKREYGLMDRRHLPDNQGMLFKFRSPIYASFWMKNTYIPLDIAFLDDDGRILQIESMSPLNTKAIYSNYPCRYALEVNKNWFRENGIKVGNRIRGEGININQKTSQTTQTNSLFSGGTPGIADTTPTPASEPAPVSPDVMLNLTNKERIKKADIRGQKLLIIYQTKEGKVLPPKVISPPFTFEKDAKGSHDAIIKAWDEQTAGWKSFLIDNIISLEEQVNKPSGE